MIPYRFATPWCVPQWGAAELRATAGALLAGRPVRGPARAGLPAAVTQLVGRGEAFGCDRGRVAIEWSLRAFGIGAGHDVVLPTYICDSVREAVVRAGARPVYADIGPDLHVTRETVARALTPATRAVIVAHLFGRAADIAPVADLCRERGLRLIDDAAQSVGARRDGRPVGAFGDAGIVSCGPGKALAGAAGAVLLMHDPAAAAWLHAHPLPETSAWTATLRALRFWWWRRLRRDTLLLAAVLDRLRVPALPAREGATALANVDAAIALAQVDRLRRNREVRRAHHARWRELLGPLAAHDLTDASDDGMCLKAIVLLPGEGPALEEVGDAFAACGVEVQGGYRPCHLGEPGHPPLVEAERRWTRVLCIPLETPPPSGPPAEALKRLAARLAEGAVPEPAHA